jgi:DNA helicase II / ATP-dependent DNA helicase PcrA
LTVANKPSRMLSRMLLEKMIGAAKQQKLSIQSMLDLASTDLSLGLSRWQAKPVRELMFFLSELNGKLNHPDASEVLTWMLTRLDLLAYFQDYYGAGENADEKSRGLIHFLQYVKELRLSPLDLLKQLSKIDTTQGKPEKELIVFTTIFRTKGLEYDYVIIPQCDENLLPYLKGEPLDIYDTRGFVPECRMSSSIENERRLFYVGITRARKGVMISSSAVPSRFLEEIKLTSTERLMNLVESLATGDLNAREELSITIQQNNADRLILRNLIEGYLADLEYRNVAINTTSLKYP